MQDLITYTIVLLAAAYTAFSFYRILFPGKKPAGNTACSSCGGCSLSKEIMGLN